MRIFIWQILCTKVYTNKINNKQRTMRSHARSPFIHIRLTCSSCQNATAWQEIFVFSFKRCQNFLLLVQSAKCLCAGGATLLPTSAGWFEWRVGRGTRGKFSGNEATPGLSKNAKNFRPTTGQAALARWPRSCGFTRQHLCFILGRSVGPSVCNRDTRPESLV
jgi:hypothetical protein